MKRIIILLVSLAALSLALEAGIFYWQNLRGAYVAVKGPDDDVTTEVSSTMPTSTTSPVSLPREYNNGPFKLPPGFKVSIFAKQLPGARVLVFDGMGNMIVSETKAGKIIGLEIKDGVVTSSYTILSNLRKPHGLALDPDDNNELYYATEGGIYKIHLYTEDEPHKIIDLPTGGNHFTRTIAFAPDKRLYVSIGSTCNVCHETDPRRAAIYSLNKDGTDFKLEASGLRNAVFFTWGADGRMWATDNGRDLLGDNTPPDEINIIQSGKNYGWPNCYGKNIHDDAFDKNVYIRNPCMEPFEISSAVDLQAHSAALGLAFAPTAGWPTDYANNLIVAYHGSWNRTVPTGYKLVRVKLGAQGNYLGTEDFMTGFLSSAGKKLGRPVDVVAAPDGSLYVSDDSAGVIYKITYPQ